MAWYAKIMDSHNRNYWRNNNHCINTDLLKCAEPVKYIMAGANSAYGTTMMSSRRCYKRMKSEDHTWETTTVYINTLHKIFFVIKYYIIMLQGKINYSTSVCEKCGTSVDTYQSVFAWKPAYP